MRGPSSLGLDPRSCTLLAPGCWQLCPCAWASSCSLTSFPASFLFPHHPFSTGASRFPSELHSPAPPAPHAGRACFPLPGLPAAPWHSRWARHGLQGPCVGAPAPLHPHPVPALTSPPPLASSRRPPFAGPLVGRDSPPALFSLECAFPFSLISTGRLPSDVFSAFRSQPEGHFLRESYLGPLLYAKSGPDPVFLLNFSSVCDGTFIRGAGQAAGFAHCSVLSLAPEPRSSHL